MNPKYLASLYKAQAGESLVDTLHKARIVKAKELLGNPRISIVEAAARTGYVNSNALIRAFKHYEGITPGKYKEVRE